MTHRLVVFDWDGTLVDSVGRITAGIRRAINHADLPPRTDDAIREIIGLGMVDGIAALYPDHAEHARRALQEAAANPVVRAELEGPTPLFAGTRPLLDRLADHGILLAVATGKSRAGLERDLAATQLAPRFAAVRTADDGPGKPSPWMLESLLAETGSRARETIVVGDTLYDLQMAAAAGVDALGVTWGVHAPERLETAEPRAIVRHFSELSVHLLPDERADARILSDGD